MRSLLTVLLLLHTPALASAQEAPFRFEPLTRIGCAECAGPEMFTRVMGLAVWDDRVYVLDRTAPMVRVFDTAGKPIRAFAGTGDGPGELRAPIQIFPRAGGGVDVFDMQQTRISSYDSAGAPTGASPVSVGLFALLDRHPRSAVTYYSPLVPTQSERTIMRFADGSDEPEEFTVLRPNAPTPRSGEPIRSPIMRARPAGGIAIGLGYEAYQIRLFDERGGHVRDIVRSIPRLRKTDAEIASERSGREGINARLSAAMSEAGRTPPRIPTSVDEEHRHFTDFKFDAAGRLWVRTERGRSEGTLFDVFDPEGGYMGEVLLPHHVSTFALGDGVFVAPVQDEDGVQYISVWRVR